MAETQPDVLGEELVEDLDEAKEIMPITHSITAYGADYPVDTLIQRLKSGDIAVPAFDWISDETTEVVGFQREYVWPKPKADRFIESLLIGLPVPGIFLVKEASGRSLVLDGHQRLQTLRSYYQGVIRGKEYRLENVQERFKNKLYKELDMEDRRQIDDSIIHATIVRQDKPSDDQSSIYMVFERLNSGGVNLQPQEIRMALYHGELVRVLKALNEESSWRQLYGNKSRRLKDMELILRFFAFYYYADNYSRPMKDFLNRYMASNRQLDRQTEAELRRVFCRTVSLLAKTIGQKAFRLERAVNAAVVDSLMIGVANRLERGDIKETEGLKAMYDSLLSNDDYIRAVRTATADDANVQTRMRLARNAFAEVI